MEKRLAISAALLMVVFGLAVGNKRSLALAEVKILGGPAPAGAPVKEVEITAKKYAFSPSRIEVPSNTLLRIHLTSLDREHGFEISSYKGSCVKFKPGEPATIELYVDKPGEYGFSCCKYCGLGHGKMTGMLIVK
jgi:cytochrome c oxidase subunit 2